MASRLRTSLALLPTSRTLTRAPLARTPLLTAPLRPFSVSIQRELSKRNPGPKWTKHEPVTYDELKPITQSPDDVSGCAPDAIPASSTKLTLT